MKTWADFYDFYLADVSGCTYFAAANQIRRAAQELCQRAKVWRIDLDPVFTTESVAVYDFEITSDQEVVKLVSAKLDSKPLDLLTPDCDTDRSKGIMALNQREFMLLPTPDAGLQVTMKVVLQPSHTSTGIDDFLFAHYAEDIANGAKARLYLEPDKPYTNPSLAKICQDKFDMAVGSANIRAAKSYSGAPLRTRASFL